MPVGRSWHWLTAFATTNVLEENSPVGRNLGRMKNWCWRWVRRWVVCQRSFRQCCRRLKTHRWLCMKQPRGVISLQWKAFWTKRSPWILMTTRASPLWVMPLVPTELQSWSCCWTAEPTHMQLIAQATAACTMLRGMAARSSWSICWRLVPMSISRMLKVSHLWPLQPKISRKQPYRSWKPMVHSEKAVFSCG